MRVLGRKRELGGDYLIVEQGDGTRSLLPMWITSPDAATFPLVEFPRLSIEALRKLGFLVDSLSAGLSETRPGGDLDARSSNTARPRPEAGPDEQGRSAQLESGRDGNGGAIAERTPAHLHKAKRSR